MQSIITKNGNRFDSGHIEMTLQYFADPVFETEMFDSAMGDFQEDGSFDFVKDNDVYVITIDEDA